jgi:tripartite-type tricarboxylate transporter receptor subunit TctC
VPVVVENVGGATTVLGAQRVARSTPDGYTILIIGSDFVVQPLLRKDLPFDPAKDFIPVAMMGVADLIYVVNAKMPANTFKDFLALAKEKPGSIRYSTAGIGTLQHFSGELLAQRAGIEMLHIPYKGGAPAAAAVVTGEVDMVVTALVSIKGHVDGGRVRVLVSDGVKRSPNMPNVPTMAESGFPDMTIGAWTGIFAPAGTPPEAVRRLRTELEAIAQTPEFRTRADAMAVGAPVATGEQFQDFLNQQTAKFRKAIEDNRSKFVE